MLRFPERYVKLSAEATAELDEADRLARAEGRRAGHSHAVASGQCVRADGRLLGRAAA